MVDPWFGAVDVKANVRKHTCQGNMSKEFKKGLKKGTQEKTLKDLKENKGNIKPHYWKHEFQKSYVFYEMGFLHNQ